MVVLLTTGCIQTKQPDLQKPIQQVADNVNQVDQKVEELNVRVQKIEEKSEQTDQLIEGTRLFNECVAEFTDMEQNEVKESEKALSAICYSQVAETLHDASWCNNINDVPLRDLCLSHVSTQSTQCDDLENAWAKAGCYREVAREQKDYTICNGIRGLEEPLPVTQMGCYRQVASDTGNIQICTLIKNDEVEKAYCYSGVAAALRDISLCDFVPSVFDAKRAYQITKEGCVRFIEELPNS